MNRRPYAGETDRVRRLGDEARTRRPWNASAAGASSMAGSPLAHTLPDNDDPPATRLTRAIVMWLVHWGIVTVAAFAMAVVTAGR